MSLASPEPTADELAELGVEVTAVKKRPRPDKTPNPKPPPPPNKSRPA